MFEAYSVAVRVSLINNVTSGLIALSRQFRGADKDAKNLQHSLDRIAKQAAIGTALAATGGAGLGLIGKAINASKDYASQLSILNQLGMRQSDIAAGVKAAWQTAYDVPTTRVGENLKTLRELRSVFGSDPAQEAEARQMLPYVQRVSGVLTALTGRPQEHVGFDLIKAAELRTTGLMTPEKLQRNVDMMSRALIAMGGTINASDLHMAMKMTKSSGSGWSDTFAFTLFPTLLQELKTKNGGGGSAGTYMATFDQAINGRIKKAAMPLWVEGGLVAKRDIVKNAGGQWQLRPGSVVGMPLYEQNPFEWAQKFLGPAVRRVMDAQHITFDAAIKGMFQDRNAAFVAKTLLLKAPQFLRDQKLIMQAKNSEQAYQSLLKTNPLLAQQALEDQLHNQMVVIGYTILPDLLKVMGSILPYLKNFTVYLRENEKAVGIAVKAFGALSFVLTAAGGTMMLGAGFSALKTFFGVFSLSGPIATAIPKLISFGADAGGAVAALGTTLGWWTAPIVAALAAIGGGVYFVGKGWESKKSAWQNVKDGLGDYWKWIVDTGKKALDQIRKWEKPGKKADSIQRGAAHALQFTDGFVGGFIDQMKDYKDKATKLVGELSPVWKGMKDGLRDFVKGMQNTADQMRKIVPFLFPTPPKTGPAGPGGKPKPGFDYYQGGRWLGRQFGSALLDVGAAAVGFGPVRSQMKAFESWNAMSSAVSADKNRKSLTAPASGLPANKPLVPPPQKQPVVYQYGDVYLDGSKVGRHVAPAVTREQERGLERAARGSAGTFDTRRSLAPVGLGVA